MKRGAAGIALVEAILLGLVLIVPLVIALGVLEHVHRAALATSTAAREAGFAVARSTDPAGSDGRIQEAIALALNDHDLDARAARVDVSLPDGSIRGGFVRVEVRYPVETFGIGGFRALPPVWVEARHDAVIDSYRSR